MTVSPFVTVPAPAGRPVSAPPVAASPRPAGGSPFTTVPAAYTPPAPAPASAAAPASFEPTGEQLLARDLYLTGGSLVIVAGAGTGKALRTDQPVLTPSGWVAIGDLRVDDQVIGSDGEPYPVLGVYPQGVRELFEVVCSDDTVIVADADHFWVTTTTKDRDRDRPPRIRTTAEIAATLTVGRTRRTNHYLPALTGPVQMPQRDLPLNPYVVGVLLGDGSLTSGTPVISNPEPEILDAVRDALPEGVELFPANDCDWRMTARGKTLPGRRGFWNPMVDILRSLDLMGSRAETKQIPDSYLFASANQRLALLQGLLDTDGSATSSGAEFSTASKVMAGQVVWLVISLGGTARCTERQPWFTYRGERRLGQTSHRLYIRLPSTVDPFRLPRKAAAYQPLTRFEPYRQIREVRPVPAAEAVCIAVGSPDRLFLTAGCIPTHNTSTLELLGLADPHRRGLYVAFNKAIVKEAEVRFPRNIEPRTAHSLAWRAIVQTQSSPWAARLRAPRMRSADVARILGIDDGVVVESPAGPKKLGPWRLASWVMRALEKFCQTADFTPGSEHFPTLVGIDPQHGPYLNNRRLAGELAPYLLRAWVDANHPHGQLPWPPSRYLKLWQLGSPNLRAGVVLCDEAQDLAPVVRDVVLGQASAGSQVVWVGDSAQQIYSFTGAIDALAYANAEHHAQLTQSWRFGPAIADVANQLLTKLDAPLRLSGNPTRDSQVGSWRADDGQVIAVLTLTNAGALLELIDALDASIPAHLVGGGAELITFAKAAERLQDRQRVDHPDLCLFESWTEVQHYVEHDEQGSDLKLLVKLTDRFGPARIIRAIQAMPAEHNARIVISTAHKAKGREWDRVRLGMDFPTGLDPTSDLPMPVPAEELRLLYVAITRARERLDIDDADIFTRLDTVDVIR